MSRDPLTNDMSSFRNTLHIDDGIVTTFVQLVNMIGTDAKGNMIAFKTKQVIQHVYMFICQV